MEEKNYGHIGTGALLKEIFSATELENCLKKHEREFSVQTLPQYLGALLEERHVLRADVIKAAGIDRSFGFQIFQGVRNPSRDKVIQLALGFSLDYEETQALLSAAQKTALYPRIKRDAAIIYCLHKGLGFTDTQALLSGMNVEILGKDNEPA